jgi:hypothetical protein
MFRITLVSVVDNVTCMKVTTWLGLVIGFTELLQNVTTYNYDSLTELHAPRITVTTAHIKSSHFAISSPVVAW